MFGKKKMLSVLLCLMLLCVLFLAVPALSESVSYIYYEWDGDNNLLTRHDDGVCANPAALTHVTRSLNDDGENKGWYTVSGQISNKNRLRVSGNVHLILLDGCNLTLEMGIAVDGENSLTIYAQSEDDQMGILTVKPLDSIACIGGSLDSPKTGKIAIQGGKISVTANKQAAGIGASSISNGGVLTIYGGKISATSNGEGAAIGGGLQDDNTVTIHGGKVSVTANGSGAGIGSGTVTITGGTVTATTYGAGAGIGNGTVTITGGTVTATTYGSGAAIGSGGSEDLPRSNCDVTINGGIVTAKTMEGSTGAGIGSGSMSDGGTVNITGGTVTAIANGSGAGIGSGAEAYSACIVNIGDGLRVLAGDSENKAEAVSKNEQVSACDSSKWARIEVCPHDIGFTITSDGKYSCYHCGPFSNENDTASCVVNINSADDWNLLGTSIGNGLPTSGRRFVLMNNISVTKMIGAANKPFKGIFDGNRNTLNFEVSASQEGIIAPFRYVSGATIQDLHVTGKIDGGKNQISGLIGENSDVTQVTDCRVSMELSGNVLVGGFCIGTGSKEIRFKGCLFDGKITGEEQCGGFVAWLGKNCDLQLTDCVSCPQDSSVVQKGGTFYYNGEEESVSGTATLNNCYSLTPFGTMQGKQVHTVTLADGVANNVRIIESYPATQIYASTTGLYWGLRYCVGKDDELYLTSDLEPKEGEYVRYFGDYAGDDGSTHTEPLAHGTGNMWLMPDHDITIRADICKVTPYGTATFRLPMRANAIGENAFAGIAAEIVYVPGGEETIPIGARSFASCPNLKQIRLPKNCKIDDAAFWGCPNLTTIFAPKDGSTENWAKENGYGFVVSK